MGISPLYSLPVLSASNCSTHIPKLATLGEVITVTLSRPARPRIPNFAPRQAPGLFSSNTLQRQDFNCPARVAGQDEQGAGRVDGLGHLAHGARHGGIQDP